MGSRGNCEIVEAKDELSPIRRPRPTREQRPPLNKAPHKSLEDDINKLFESVNLRTSKSLDLSDWRRNASKKPIRGVGSHSPGIGFSEPVSLKQALRGLCISQAAEMAAVKRLSMPQSPRISETGKITNLYRSTLVAEAGGSGIEISLVPEESTSSSAENLTRQVKSATQSSCSSPSLNVKPITNRAESSSSESFPRLGDKVGTSLANGETPSTACSSSKIVHHNLQEQKIKPISQTTHSSSHKPIPSSLKTSESSVHSDPAPMSKVDKQFPDLICSEEEHDIGCALPHDNVNDSKPDKKNSGSAKVARGPSKDSSTPTKVLNRQAPKVRRKSRLQNVSSASAVKSPKDAKPTRSTSRAIKPVRNKNLIIKKPKKVAVSSDGNSKTSYEVNSTLDHGPGQLICQRCQCSLKDTSKDPPSAKIVQVVTDSQKFNASYPDSAPPVWENGCAPVAKTYITSKFSEKGDISQSSKSSICDFSSSTTSLSEESNLSGSAGGNRPHMSKDTRWEAINHVKRQYGFLGLSHFNLLKKLGSGDIGTVYLAELIGTNCPFAIKVMDNEFLARRKKMPRAQTEREILRMLDHPFLPTLYAQFTSDNLSCLVMEFCPGGDLHVLRQKQPGRYFPEQAARFYVAEVLLALEYLHMLGIVYRDLKPENILVREDGHIMLTDFDLSLRCSVNPTLVKASSFAIEPPRISGPCAGSNCIDPFCTGPSCKVSCFSPRLLPATARSRKLKTDSLAHARSLPQLVAEPTEARSNSFVGTHEYLAPEIIKGEGHGSAVDWWTFGVFLYELLYGKTPFKGAGNEETLTNVVLQNLKFPDTPIVSFQARDLIRGLLVKEPENRLGTETGAAEIKRHPFFDGLNWALIRCAVPPQVPEVYEGGNPQLGFQEKGKKFIEYNANGEHLEFELF